MIVRDHMTRDPLAFSPGEDVKVAFGAITDLGVRQAPVVEDGKLVGIITDRDLRVAVVQTMDGTAITVKSVMTRDPFTVTESSNLADAARIISSNKFNALPVLSEDGKLVGLLTTTDILNGLVAAMEEAKK